MMQLDDVILTEHYIHHKDKPFFDDLKEFMKKSPVVVACLEGLEAVSVVRAMCGETSGRKAQPGTIRGDFSMSVSSNIIHSSDSLETAQKEVERFFNEDELTSYQRSDYEIIYAPDEK